MRVRLLPDRRWSQLVDTAVGVLESVPAHDVVIDDIATRAGVSRSLVYRYFSGLDDLLDHARERFLTTLDAEYGPILGRAGDALEQLRAVIAATVHFAAAHPGVYANFAAGGRPDPGPGDPLTRAMLYLTLELRPGCDAELAATAMAALIEAGIVSGLRDDRTDTDTAALTDLVFSLAASGLQARSTEASSTGKTTASHPDGSTRSAFPLMPLHGVSLGAPSGSGNKGALMTMEENQ